jgi:hypothetical protein
LDLASHGNLLCDFIIARAHASIAACELSTDFHLAI